MISHLTVSEPNFHEMMKYFSDFTLFMLPREHCMLLAAVIALLYGSLSK